VALENGSIVRLQFDRSDPRRIRSVAPLVEPAAGAVRAIAVSPGGAVYFCLDDRVARVVAATPR
jgi:hypothetical protein